MALLILLVVIVTMRQFAVIVLVRVPRRSMLEIVTQPTLVMVRDVIVIVRVRDRRVSVGRLLALAIGPLCRHAFVS
jgi:hypothetical protein